jgi:hypothetical protein
MSRWARFSVISAAMAATLITPAAASAAISFGTSNQYAAGAGSSAVEQLDADRDGVTDLAVAASASANLLRGLGPGDFGLFDPIDLDLNPGQSLLATRLDRGRTTDLAIVNDSFDPARVAILRSRGNGNFREPRNYRAGAGPYELAGGDFDNDGNRDLIASSLAHDNRLSVLYGRGDGTFAKARSVPVGADTQEIAAGDLNGDGRSDFAVVNTNSDVLLGYGRSNRRFRRPEDIDPGINTVAIEIADLDGDRRRDIALTHSPNGNDFVSVLWRRKRGFDSPPVMAIGANVSPQSIALGDLNGDGLREIVAGNAGGSVTVFENTGGRTFAAPITLDAGDEPQDVEIARIDDDALRDIVTANNVSGDVSVLLNGL